MCGSGRDIAISEQADMDVAVQERGARTDDLQGCRNRGYCDRNIEGLVVNLPRAVEGLLCCRARHSNAVQLCDRQHIHREGHIIARGKTAVKRQRIHTRLIDRDGRAVVRMADRAAVNQAVAVKDKGCLAASGLRRRGKCRKQLDRGAAAGSTPRDNKVKYRSVFRTTVCDSSVSAGFPGRHGANADGRCCTGVAVFATRAGCACGTTRTSCSARSSCTAGAGGSGRATRASCAAGAGGSGWTSCTCRPSRACCSTRSGRAGRAASGSGGTGRARCAARSHRTAFTTETARPCRAGGAGRGDVKRKAAISPDTSGKI